jgi:hypothetical protein
MNSFVALFLIKLSQPIFRTYKDEKDRTPPVTISLKQQHGIRTENRCTFFVP